VSARREYYEPISVNMQQSHRELDASDRNFLDAFERCEIAPENFHHRDHIRLAYIYLRQHDADTTLTKMRSGLQRFLVHAGAPATKYHETITRAWLLAVEHFMNETAPTSSFEEFAAAAPRLFAPGAMETHYTRELLRSDEARERFVEPDLQPIPPPK